MVPEALGVEDGEGGDGKAEAREADSSQQEVEAVLGEYLPICIGCGRRPWQIGEYVEAVSEDGFVPANVISLTAKYVRHEEGTYNKSNGHFLCTACYIDAGMPTSPGGWVCP